MRVKQNSMLYRLNYGQNGLKEASNRMTNRAQFPLFFSVAFQTQLNCLKTCTSGPRLANRQQTIVVDLKVFRNLEDDEL